MTTPALRRSIAMSVAVRRACKLPICCRRFDSGSGLFANDSKPCSDSVISLSGGRLGVGGSRLRNVGFEVERLQQRVDVRVALAIFERVVEKRLGEVQPALDFRDLRLDFAQVATRN